MTDERTPEHWELSRSIPRWQRHMIVLVCGPFAIFFVMWERLFAEIFRAFQLALLAGCDEMIRLKELWKEP